MPCQRHRGMIVVAGLMNTFLGTSLMYSAGIIHFGLLGKYRHSPTQVSWASALFSSTFFLAGPISSSVANALSCRYAIFIGVFLNFVGFFVSSFLNSIEAVVLCYGIIAGTGQSMTYSGTVLAVGFYFHDNPSVPTGIVVFGAGIGVFVFPTLTEFLIQTYGIDGAFLLLSGICLQVMVFNMCIPTHPLEIERKKKSKTLWVELKLIILEFRKILSTGAYLCFCISIFCWSASLNISLIYLPQYYVSTGSTPMQAAMLMSLYGLTGCSARLLIGMAASDAGVDGKILYMGSYTLLGIATLSLPVLGTSFPGKVFYSTILGLYSSGVWSLLIPITMEIVGVKQMPTAFGMELLVGGVGFLLSPVAGGKIKREGDDYSLIFIISGAVYFLAAVFELLMILTMKKSESFNERHNTEKNIEVAQHLIEGPIGNDDNNITESAQESSV